MWLPQKKKISYTAIEISWTEVTAKMSQYTGGSCDIAYCLPFFIVKVSHKFGYSIFRALKQAVLYITFCILTYSGSQWPCGLRHRSLAARLLRLWVRIPPGAWMSLCFEFCVLSGTGLCDALITRPEESYRLWCVVVCDLETSWMRRPWP